MDIQREKDRKKERNKGKKIIKVEVKNFILFLLATIELQGSKLEGKKNKYTLKKKKKKQ